MSAFGSSATAGTGYLSGGRTKREDRAGALARARCAL